MMVNNLVKYDICYVALPEPKPGSCVQGGQRPAVVVSNNMCNKHSPVISVVPVTSRDKKRLPTHVSIWGYGLNCECTVMCEQITSVDKSSITKRIGNVSHESVRAAIDKALLTQFAS